MSKIELECQAPGCNIIIDGATEGIAIALFNSHQLCHTPGHMAIASPSAAPKQKAPKMERPHLIPNASEEEWNNFTRRWDLFRKCTDMRPTEITAQLFQCCDEDLGNQLLKEDPTIVDDTESALLTAMKRLSVIPVAISVRRADLLLMRQDHGESIRSFYAKVKGKAATCNYTATCRCSPATSVDFTDIIVRDVVVAGLSDIDIKKDVLGWVHLDKASTPDVISFIEGKEMARHAMTSVGSTAAVSSFKQQKRALRPTQDTAPTAKCPECSRTFKLFTEGPRGWNTKPHKFCLDCWKKTKSRTRNRQKPQDTNNGKDHIADGETGGLVMHIGTVNGSAPPSHQQRPATLTTESNNLKTSIELTHHIFTSNSGWIRARSLSHPTVRLRLTTKDDDYRTFHAHCPHIQPTYVEVITDSGAQSCLWSRKEFERHGFRQADLIPVRYAMTAANTTPFQIDGAIFVRLDGRDKHGSSYSCATMVYISPDANGFYLSREAMIQLGIISHSFPQVGAALNGRVAAHSSSQTNHKPTASGNIRSDNVTLSPSSLDSPCSCPKRELPPGPPRNLPFACTPENNSKMKEWLLERYESSTFNTCPHQLLPNMKGPPIKILVKPNAVPVVSFTPATIPIHWQEQVERDLLRDEALGVIERVPHGEPTTWCHRMVITRKHDGGPRRTVDLSPLNKHCCREAHSTRSPFHLARSVPPNTWKTVTDAWNGYHSVPIHAEDRHLTTFITPIGRFRYQRAPQGFLSSGDGYNRRFDEIITDFTRKQRCVDDTVFYDIDLHDHWWRTIQFLEIVGNAGIILNPEKFQFANKTVDFAGFRLSESTVEPLPKYIDAIKSFPKPSSITDIRSWFGLVNQISCYAQLRNIMSPFKPLLSPKSQFTWTADLDRAFNDSKDQIIAAIKQGVAIFDINRRTCLRTDWSKSGIGYYLSQKHCACLSSSPGCCNNGWKITLAGSRFLSSTEKRYAPVEGEMLAVAWSLEQTKYFTQGCDNLLVVTDHKPLTKLLGDRTLDEITNTRLFRIKQRTLPWRFDILHQPGISNHVADAASRHPVDIVHYELASVDMRTEKDLEELEMIAAIQGDFEKLRAVTWNCVKDETRKDSTMMELATMLANGFPAKKEDLTSSLREFWEFRHSLYESDGVILYHDRVLIPPVLRASVLDVLHSAHQGVSAMTATAQATVFWPGISRMIQERRDKCNSCNRNAPSNARLPPAMPRLPTTPFEAIFADYFQFRGWNYLVIGDRLSGWTEIYRIREGATESGARGLITCLRKFFATFGVPEELSTDGGPQFTAGETKDFLQLWGIRHRISSAYHPQSNGRAELAVKATKRLLNDNIGANGCLDNDTVLRALLTLRNTPDPDCRLSPAQILFGRRLRDAMPSTLSVTHGRDHPPFQALWRDAWAAKEAALRTRYAKTLESLSEHSRPLPPLHQGDRVFLQNQIGIHPTKWDRSGTVVERHDYDQYTIKVDGTGRLTNRNRRYLRKFVPHSMIVQAPLLPCIQDYPVHAQHSTEAQSFSGSPSSQTNEDTGPPSGTQGVTKVQPTSRSHSLSPTHHLMDNRPESFAINPFTADNDEVTNLPHHPRRSSRNRKQRLVYDSASGSFVKPHT